MTLSDLRRKAMAYEIWVHDLHAEDRRPQQAYLDALTPALVLALLDVVDAARNTYDTQHAGHGKAFLYCQDMTRDAIARLDEIMKKHP